MATAALVRIYVRRHARIYARRILVYRAISASNAALFYVMGLGGPSALDSTCLGPGLGHGQGSTPPIDAFFYVDF